MSPARDRDRARPEAPACGESGQVPPECDAEHDPAPPTWAGTREAVAVCRYRPNLRRVSAITVAVGTLLTGINQGTLLAAGRLDWVIWTRILLDYLIPACVSTMGVLAGSRRQRRGDRQPGGP